MPDVSTHDSIRALAALAARVVRDRGRRRSAAAHRVVQRLRRPAGGRARRSRPDRRAVALCARSRDLGGGRARRANYPRLALQAEAMVPLKPDLVLVGTWDRPLTQRMLRGLGFRVVGVDVVNDVATGRRADPRGRGAARPSRARRGAGRGDRSGAAAACRGAAAEVVERAAGRQQRLHRRPRQPRRRAAARGRAGAAAGRAERLRRLRAAREADHAAAGLSRDVEHDRDAGRAGRALSHASGAARALSAGAADRAAGPLHAVRGPEPGRGVRLSRRRADAARRASSSYALRRPFREHRGERIEPVGERGRAGLQDQRRLDLAQPARAHRRDRVEARRAPRPSPARISCRTRSRR